MKKKVAVFIPTISGRGGMETAISNLYQLVRNDNEYDFSFIFAEGVKDKNYMYSFDKKNIVYHPHTNIFLETLFLLRIMRQRKFDIMIVTSRRLMILLSYLRNFMLKKPLIVSWLHFSISKKRGIYIDLSKYGDAHFAISKGMALQMEKMGVSKQNIYYLPNCVITPRNFVKASSKVKFIYIGRIEFLKQKNIKELIDGLSLLKFDWSIDIYGDGDDRKKCEDYVREKYPHLKNNIVWKGWTNNPWDSVTEGTALLLSSKFEGMPMVLIEAISRGLPIFSSDCETGPKDIMDNGINGYMYKLGDINDLSRKLTLLVNTSFNRNIIRERAKFYNSENYLKRLKKYLSKLDNYGEDN